MKKIIFLVLLSSSLFSNAAEVTLHTLLNDGLEIELPNELNTLTQSRIINKYKGKKLIPLHEFSNKKAGVTFSFTALETPADRKSMKGIHKALSTMYRNAQPDAKWSKDKLNKKFGTKVAIFEYEVKGMNTTQYCLTYSFPVDGKLVLASFVSSNTKYKSKWKSLAKEAFQNIEIL
jgi:hypothetical protein